jgi:chromosome segregation ATPase
VEKDYTKIKALMGEKSRLREMVDNLKIQLSEKEKEVANLREKILNLRKNNQVLQTQVNSRIDQQPIA